MPLILKIFIEIKKIKFVSNTLKLYYDIPNCFNINQKLFAHERKKKKIVLRLLVVKACRL
jgi:hypothetical protein